MQCVRLHLISHHIEYKPGHLSCLSALCLVIICLQSCAIRSGAAVVLVDPLWWIVWLALCCLHCLHCHRWLARANYGLPCIIAAPQWVEAPRGGTGITSRWTKWTTPLKQPDKPTALAFMRRCFAWKGLRTKCWFKNVKVGRFIHRRSSSPVYDKSTLTLTHIIWNILQSCLTVSFNTIYFG